MEENNPHCPQCHSQHTYPDGHLWVCPECAHEWIPGTPNEASTEESSEFIVKDAHGTILHEGDTVSIIKDLKVKGSSSSIKVGTKVRNIQLSEGNDGHNISCKIEGFGAMNLKSEFVKKV